VTIVPSGAGASAPESSAASGGGEASFVIVYPAELDPSGAGWWCYAFKADPGTGICRRRVHDCELAREGETRIGPPPKVSFADLTECAFELEAACYLLRVKGNPTVSSLCEPTMAGCIAVRKRQINSGNPYFELLSECQVAK
jgi:hypothetical protein